MTPSNKNDASLPKDCQSEGKKWNDVCSCQRLSDRDRSVWNPKGGQFVNDSLFEAQLCHWLTFRGSTLSLTHFSGCKCGHEVGYNGYNFARQMKNLWNDWKCCRCKAFRRGVCVWPCSYYLLSTSNHHPSLGKTSTLQAGLETWIEKIHPEDFLNELLIREVFSNINSLWSICQFLSEYYVCKKS